MQTFVLILESTLGYAHAAVPQWSNAELGSLAYSIPVLLLGAVSEEMPVRGYLFQNLREAWGPWPALIATSLLFAALHLFNPSSHSDILMTMIGVAAAGALFCLSVVVSGSLWIAVGCHFAWNLFEGPVFGFPVSGLSIGSAHIMVQSVNGPEWFTGGAFGPEAGASALIALAVGAAMLFVLHRSGALAG
jgi:membrane protease YdiL (CAAX protease family)